MSLVPVGRVRFYVLNLAGKGVKMLPMSDGQFRALETKLSITELGYLAMRSTEEEAIAFMSDYVATMDALNCTNLVELLGLSE